MAGRARTTPAATALRRRPQLSEDVANHVRHLVMSGEVRPGDYIRLDETAAELGVSVTPVREALLTLRGEGMVELVPHRGYVVSALTPADIADIFWLQGRIAVELVRRAAPKIGKPEIAELKKFNASLAAAVANGRAEEVEVSEFEFHRVINRLAEANKLAWFLNNATRYTPTRLYASDPEWGRAAVRNHEQLIDALNAGDVDAACTLMRKQFTDGAERLVAYRDM
ncbi:MULTISPECIES: GntR family transcriptional regulator [unclassified Rhodococcus (in: high G+C Gram-positive bacteria)]|uniref:GntR family transcriptional regulator n=1 Tax=unclassified Rhodococcus (in: high G+C Gram-positive bacteria) TaxID=192944 RepID=UPI001B34CD4A|nr:MULTISPECIES: GntR family transcriptional regulator [unclassified Rhodococcus (in: high G+C Gram-positive bacteria)]